MTPSPTDRRFNCGIPENLRTRLQGKISSEEIRLNVTITAVDNPVDTRMTHLQTSRLDWQVLEWNQMAHQSGFGNVMA
jgi:hypothetical protein